MFLCKLKEINLKLRRKKRVETLYNFNQHIYNISYLYFLNSLLFVSTLINFKIATFTLYLLIKNSRVRTTFFLNYKITQSDGYVLK